VNLLREIFQLLKTVLLEEGDDRRNCALYHTLYGQSLSALVGVEDGTRGDIGETVPPLADVLTVLK